MAHFAELDQNNIVKRVIVVSNKDNSDENGIENEEYGIAFCKRLFGEHTNWKQTSYNNKIRKRYAGKGMIYDEFFDAFISPQPFMSWSLNQETLEWEAPVPMPPIMDGQNGYYTWNEDYVDWEFIEVTPLLQEPEQTEESEAP